MKVRENKDNSEKYLLNDLEKVISLTGTEKAGG